MPAAIHPDVEPHVVCCKARAALLRIQRNAMTIEPIPVTSTCAVAVFPIPAAIPGWFMAFLLPRVMTTASLQATTAVPEEADRNSRKARLRDKFIRSGVAIAMISVPNLVCGVQSGSTRSSWPLSSSRPHT